MVIICNRCFESQKIEKENLEYYICEHCDGEEGKVFETFEKYRQFIEGYEEEK